MLPSPPYAPHRGRAVIAASPVSSEDVLQFLELRPGWHRVRAVLSWPDRAGSAARAGSPVGLRKWVAAGVRASRDLSVSTGSGRSKVGLINRAMTAGAAYVHTHDDDHAWFSGLSIADERALFEFFLERASGMHATVRAMDWRVLRKGLFAHGWSCRMGTSGVVQLFGTAEIPLWWIEMDERAGRRAMVRLSVRDGWWTLK
jgi:hypothetical protein